MIAKFKFKKLNAWSVTRSIKTDWVINTPHYLFYSMCGMNACPAVHPWNLTVRNPFETTQIYIICNMFRCRSRLSIGECPSNSPFLKNNGAEAHWFYGMERYEDILQLKIHPLYFNNFINYYSCNKKFK